MAVEVVSRIRVGSGAYVEQLACHPGLPLVAGEESSDLAAHVWDYGGGQLREAGTISAAAGARSWWPLAMAWESGGSLLLAATAEIRGAAGTVARWTPAGVTGLCGLPPTARYWHLAFSPDRRALWASPSRDGPDWALSDIVDLASGVIWAGQRWDTGVAAHPGGGLVATLATDGCPTYVLFARVDQGRAPAAMRLLRRALILDYDGYATPTFSPDGRHLAIRGNSYKNSLDVFQFPSLSRALAATIPGKPQPGRIYPPRHNIAFGARPGQLWVGTPAGTLVETDLDSSQTASHDVLDGAPVTGLAATADGDLIVATGAGELALVSVTPGHPAVPAPDALRDQAAAFLASTSVVPDDRDLDAHLVVTDGARTWGPPIWQRLPPAPSRPGYV